MRPATADPQAIGQASSTTSALGDLRKLPATILSIAGAIGSTGISILTFRADLQTAESQTKCAKQGQNCSCGPEKQLRPPRPPSGIAGSAEISTPYFQHSNSSGKLCHDFELYFGNNILAESSGSGDDDGDRAEDEATFEEFVDLHEIDWIVVFAYFDETGMHATALDTVVAGYLFSKDGAKKFQRTFQEKILPLLPVNKKGQRIFHANKCCPVHGNGEYATLSEPDRQHIVDLMVNATNESVTLGSVVGMEKHEYAKAISRSPVLAQVAGSEYTVCLMRCIANIAEWLDKKNIAGRVMYVFEAGCEHEEEAQKLFARMSRSEELKKRYRWHNYTFVEKTQEVPQLFSPDLLAWEWQRARVNSENPQRGEWRASFTNLIKGTPHIRLYLTETSVGISAIMNMFYGLTSAKPPYEISNPFFKLKDFPSDKT